MSELIQKNDNCATIRWKLLTGVSALAFAAYVIAPETALAEDVVHPLIWLELDGQFAQQRNDVEVYNPDFLSASPFDAESHLGLERAPTTIWDKGTKLTFQPDGSDWVLSAGIQFGKASRFENPKQQISHVPYKYWYKAYQNPSSYGSESHTILDFQAGRDLGLGSFGSGGKSTFSAGVRIAQFDSRTLVDIKSRPTTCPYYCHYNKFYASFDGRRSFKGIGPALSWDASAMIAGNSSNGGISLDWGVNGAVLFGRQKMSEHHQTTKRQLTGYHEHDSTIYQKSPDPISRSKNVTVPNLGAFAGVSWRYAAAKVTMGYRADYFFGVLDGGIDTAKKEDRAFYGPFVSIAVGIGD